MEENIDWILHSEYIGKEPDGRVWRRAIARMKNGKDLSYYLVGYKYGIGNTYFWGCDYTYQEFESLPPNFTTPSMKQLKLI